MRGVLVGFVGDGSHFTEVNDVTGFEFLGRLVKDELVIFQTEVRPLPSFKHERGLQSPDVALHML